MKQILQSVLFFTVLISYQIYATPSKIIIIRHAEKLEQKNPGPYLSPAGMARSMALPQYLAQFGEPEEIFATGITKPSDSLRPIQTIIPTANYFASLYPNDSKKVDKFTVNTTFLDNDYSKLAKHILGKKKFDGKIIFIAWHHGKIPALAQALGVKNPPKWDPAVFDKAWVITFDSSAAVKSFDILTQKLNK